METIISSLKQNLWSIARRQLALLLFVHLWILLARERDVATANVDMIILSRLLAMGPGSFASQLEYLAIMKLYRNRKRGNVSAFSTPSVK